jgi:hypothetical protein
MGLGRRPDCAVPAEGRLFSQSLIVKIAGAQREIELLMKRKFLRCKQWRGVPCYRESNGLFPCSATEMSWAYKIK